MCTRRTQKRERRLLSLATILLVGLQSVGCEEEAGERGPWSVSSPDERLTLELELITNPDDGARRTLSYSLLRDGEAVIEPSPLGLETDDGSFVSELSFVSWEERDVEESYQSTVGKRRERSVRGSEAVLTLRNAGGDELELILRVHDDGAAFRYRLPGQGEVRVLREVTGFAMDRAEAGYMAPYDVGGIFFFGTYEQIPHRVDVGEATSATGWAYPALFEMSGGDTWLMITEADLDESYCGTRLGPEPEGSLYRVRFPDRLEGNTVGEVEPRSERPLTTPWRVIIAGDLATVTESTLVDDLSRPAAVEDRGWIRPGRAAWSWFTQDTGDPALQREYLDFAAELGWEYILIDAGWDQWPEVEEVMPELVAEAAAQGVGVLLWYNSGGDHTFNHATPRDRMLDPEVRRAEMDLLETWGVAGIKVDFFESDKQDRIRQYLEILRDAAPRRLLVNFHGATLPRGWQRTYPHLMSHEAVRGAEYFRVLEGVPRPGADEDVLYVFLRNVVGSMDYTPVAFADALREADLPYVHSLAQAVLFESGIQHFADTADADPDTGYRAVFRDAPFVREILSELPVVWDETLLLEGHPESHAILARRHGERWYVAGIAGADDEVETSIPLSFLDQGTYRLQLVTQGDEPPVMESEVRSVGAEEALEVRLAPRDGVFALLEPDPSD